MPAFSELSVGQQLPSLTKTPDREQLVKYAAGSGDFNPLHYDADFPQAKAIGDNIVHGKMKYASLGQLVSDWLGHQGWVRRIAVQYRGMDMRARTFTCHGRITDLREEDDQQIVELELWVEDADGQRTTTGGAEVVLR